MAKNRIGTPEPTTIDEQIEAWKKQYGEGNVLCILIPHTNVDPNTKLKAYIKKPSITTISKISRFGEEHINKSIDIFFEDSYLGGDPEIHKYDEYKLAIIHKVMPMFEVPEAEIVKL